MTFAMHPRNDHLQHLLEKIGAALGGLAEATREAAEVAIRALLPAPPGDAAALVPFTGYYGINTAPGAFLSIDTSVVYINVQLTQRITLNLSFPTITVRVSLNGTTCQSYPFEGGASFDGKTLVIPDVLSVDLTREYQAGAVVALSGTIAGNLAAGSTYFNPVELPVFMGTYKNVATGATALTVASSSLMFDSGGGLENVPVFAYNPAMYVVQFTTASVPYVLMLGTSPGQGLACFITDGTTNSFAVTIPTS